MRQRWNCHHHRSGTATLELAVVLPLLILLFVIGVDFARVYYYNLTLINAAEGGALYASAHPDNVAKTDKIKTVTLADTKNLSPDPAVTSSSSTDENGILYVTVEVKWDFNTVVPYPGVPRPLTLTRAVKMRVGMTSPKETEPVLNPLP